MDAEYYQEKRKDEDIRSLLSGCPPYPYKSWTKEALVKALALDKLEGTRKASKFISKVIALDNCPYKSPYGIYIMYQQFVQEERHSTKNWPSAVLFSCQLMKSRTT